MIVYYVLWLVLIANSNDELNKATYVHFTVTIHSLYSHRSLYISICSLYIHYMFTIWSLYLDDSSYHCLLVTCGSILHYLVGCNCLGGILNGKLCIAIYSRSLLLRNSYKKLSGLTFRKICPKSACLSQNIQQNLKYFLLHNAWKPLKSKTNALFSEWQRCIGEIYDLVIKKRVA